MMSTPISKPVNKEPSRVTSSRRQSTPVSAQTSAQSHVSNGSQVQLSRNAQEAREQLASLMSQANLDENVVSVLKEQLQTGTEARESQNNLVNHSPSGTKYVAPHEVEEEEPEDSDEENKGEFQADNPFDADSEDDSADNDDEPLADMNPDCNQTVPNLGESDDEQEVSFNGGLDVATETINAEKEKQSIPVQTRPCTPHSSSRRSLLSPPTTLTNNVDDAGFGRSLPTVPEQFDESVMLNVIGTLRHHVSSTVNSSLDQILKEIRSDRDSVKMLRDDVDSLTSMITTMACAIFIKNQSTHPRMKEIQRHLCLLPALFNDAFMLKVIPRVVTGFISRNVNGVSTENELQLKGIELYTVLHFSRQPGETKNEKYDSEVGRVYSTYRCSLLLSSLLAMQKNSFGTFRPEGKAGGLGTITIIDDERSTVVPGLQRGVQPFWLKPGYVTSEHCMTAANKQEKRGATDTAEETQNTNESSQTQGDVHAIDMQDSSQPTGKQKLSRTGPLTQNEIGTEAAVMVYKIITGTLYRSRYATKLQLFHDVLYVFTGWKQHTHSSKELKVVNQSSLRLQWEGNNEDEKDYTANIPSAKVVRPQDRRSNMGYDDEQLDVQNIANLESIIGRHPELSLIIEHDALVNGSTKLLRYRLSLIEVACRSLSAYITLESAAKFKYALCADKQSFKSVLVLALGLRRLMEKAVSDINDGQDVPWKDNCITTKPKRGKRKQSNSTSPSDIGTRTPYKFECVNGLSLDHLQPPSSKQKEALHQMLLNLTDEEYNTKMDNVNGNDAVGTCGVGNRETRIEADESEFIFDI